MKKLFPLLLSFSLILNLFGQTGFALAKPQKPTPPPNPLQVTPTPTPTVIPSETSETQESVETQNVSPSPSQPSPPPPRTDLRFTQDAVEDSKHCLSANCQNSQNPQNTQTAQNTGNGVDSNNTSTVEQTTERTISQENKLNIENNFEIGVDTGSNFANYSIGDAEIVTGDADVSLTLLNSGNENAATVPTGENNPKGYIALSAAENQDNGAFSENTAETKTNESTTVESKNQAELKNNFAVSSKTGGNNANYTTGGDAKVQTGNANSTINVINFANTNGIEVAVKEFNILDDQTGDVTLNFGNGADSTNKTAIDDTGTLVIVNENNANVENKIVVNTDTGGNNANFTTGGDASIKTGDANIVVNVVNFLNNNLTAVGEVVVGVVNIFGNLVGNLILPGNAVNLGNGAGSSNSATITEESSETIIQSNTANIESTIELTANTGGNDANYNTGGDVGITTGKTNVNVSATTVANENVFGSGDEDTIFVVLVNEMGKWVGKVLGVTNEGNGAGSENLAEINSNTETVITQENSAAVKNNIAIDANTGNNSTSYTTDGKAAIETGDVNVVTNIVNFLNNNFVGRKIILTIVNVFGSWTGDLAATTENTEKDVEDTDPPEADPTKDLEEPVEETSNPEVSSDDSNSPTSQNTEPASGGQNTPTPIPSTSSSPSSPSESASSANGGSGGSQTEETQAEKEETSTETEVETETETVLDIVADIGSGEINLDQNLFSQSFTKKTIQQKKQKVLAQRPSITPSPWANRRLLPTVTDEIKFDEAKTGLPWSFSSAILMALGLIAGSLKRFFA